MILPPPQNSEYEKAILGSAMASEKAADWLMASMPREAFYSEKNAIVFDAMSWLYSNREPVEIFGINERLRKVGKLGDIGGPEYTLSIQNCVSTSVYFEQYGRELLRVMYDRSIVTMSHDLLRVSQSQDAEERDRIIKTLLETARLRDTVGAQIGVSAKEAVHRAIDRLEAGPAKVIKTGVPEIDMIINGTAPGDLFTIGGRTGIGKTAFLLNVAIRIAQTGKRIAFFCGEMTPDQIADRGISAITGFNQRQLRAGTFPKSWWSDITTASAIFADLPIYFCESDRPGLRDIRGFSDSVNAEIVMVDHLTRCSLPRAESVRVSVNQFMVGLKSFTRQTARHTYLAAQINRATDKAPDKRPTLSDLSESGAIEQESDIVALLYQSIEEKAKEDSTLEIMIAKGRNTGTGLAEVRFHKPSMTMGRDSLIRDRKTQGGPIPAQTEAFQHDHAKAAAGEYAEDEQIPF